ncbi:MAG: hypothetical protein ACJ8C4_08575 [Gemmataceae bacterium]
MALQLMRYRWLFRLMFPALPVVTAVNNWWYSSTPMVWAGFAISLAGVVLFVLAEKQVKEGGSA